MAVAVLAGIFGVLVVMVALRFATVTQRIVASTQAEKRLYASEIDHAHAEAFRAAMAALEAVQDRVTQSQTSLLERTMDAVAGPQHADGSPYATDAPNLDARPRWMPDDEWDYTGLGIDPTDDDMPLPHIEPEGNEHRAVMTPPGQGLLP